MKKYNNNISNYVDSEFLDEESSKIGEELSFLPEEETEANFCTLESIKPTDKDFIPNLACFLPPTHIPVLAKITTLSTDGISLKAIGIPEEYATGLDKQGGKA